MKKNYCSLFLLLLFAYLPGTAQQNWVLKTEKDGIRVYSRPGEHSKFDELKAELTVKSTLSSVAALILDIPSYANWSFNTKMSYVLKQVSPSELYFYTQINSPWPASDRDLAVHLRISQDPQSKVMTIREESVPDLIPPKKNIVRVPLSREVWTVTPIGPGTLKIEYQLEIDPGDSAPAWLVNMFATKGPHETFTNLREQVQLPQYGHANVPFIKN